MGVISTSTWTYIFITFRLFLDGVAIFSLLPTAWTYIKSLGKTEYFLGIVLSSYGVAATISGPFIGRFHDKFGKTKFIFVTSTFIKVLAHLIYSIPVSAYYPLAGGLLSGLAGGCDGVFFNVGAQNAPAKYRGTKTFVFLEGMFMIGTVIGPAMTSFLVFHFNIFGWAINRGNSPGFVMLMLYLPLFLTAFWLPGDKGTDDKEVTKEEDEEELTASVAIYRTDTCNEESKTYASKVTVMCVFYQIFFSFLLSAIRNLYIPLFAQQLFHLEFIQVKMFFVISCGVQLIAQSSVYLATGYNIKEKQFFFWSFPLQFLCIAIQFYIALNWYNTSVYNGYILLVYAIAGGCLLPLFSLGCSIISKITDPIHSSFYQASCFSAICIADVTSSLISGFLFTHLRMLYYSAVLSVLFVVETLLFWVEYRNI